MTEGNREAADRFTLARELKAEGLTVVYTELGIEKKKNSWNISFGGGVRLKDKIFFAANLSAMVGAGLTLLRALEVLEKQSSRKRFKEVIRGLSDQVKEGRPLSAALSRYPKVFPEVFTAMVATAEESGRLPESLKIVSEQMQKSYDLRRKVRGAMIYPAIIFSVMIIIGILMMIYLVPTLTATFRELDVQLPLSTKIVVGLSDFMVAHTVAVVVILFALAGGLAIFWQSRSGKNMIDRLSLRLPVIGGLAKEVNSAVIMRTVSSLLSSGVSMTRTLEITERVVGNHLYKNVLKEALEKVQKGILLSTVFEAHQNLFPIFVEEMSAVGEETGKLPDMLLKGAIVYEENIDQATKNLSTIIEPALMVVIGAAVGFFAISMIGPMYSLSEAIK